MSNVSNSVLAEIEWDEGLSMPVANSDNKALENEVQKKQSKIVSHQNELSETDDRIRAMVEHLKNVRQELQHTQGLVGARGKEAETEEHLLKIAEREEGRLKQEVGRLKKEMDELKEKKNSYENNIFKQTQKLEELKSQMNWDQQALEAWLEESARKDEDAMTIQKYTRQDESKIKELSLRMEKLMHEAMNKKNQLDNEMTNTLTSQLNTLKRTVDRTAMDLETARSNVANLKREVAAKSLKLQASIELREALVEKLKVAAESTLSAEERSLRMVEILEAEELKQKEMRAQIKFLSDSLYRKNKELQEARTTEKMTEAQIDGAHNTIKNLGSKIARLDTDALKQQEILYSQDFTLQNLERRCTRMQGDSNTEEKAILEAKIAQLQEELDKKMQTQQLLQLQLKRVQDDLRCVTRSLDQSRAEKGDLTVKIDELNLYNDNSEAELKKIIKNKQNLMVDENLLKLEIRKLRDLLMSRADDVMSLEKRKLQLDTAMKERHQEISIHKEMLTAQVKATDEERQQISAELHERISKIDKLRKRYEILMVSMAPPEGEEEKSQAYYVIKAAQEKEELQREGDDLDAKIRKAEKEIRALENTLKLMNGRNEQYRKSFNKITDSSDEMDEKRQLDEQMRAVMDKFKYKRRQIRELQDDLHNKLVQLNKEIEDQRAKLERVAKQNSRLSRELRSAKKTKENLPEEKDFEVREMREFNKMVTKLVGEAAAHYPEMEEAVSMYFTQANLPVPTAGGMPSSSRGSARSSVIGGSPASSVRSGASRGSAAAVNIGFDGEFLTD
ncbi:coiled-coil domain-containing protein 39 [Elysia marginata]|uniref:Coiled-coil domain-containing protein 39 n=1 Tax=Elysia marginata TaxID=1093978 RepID=A0AAV4H490_9GAST|nr:coiled-coil domain-containing protein 39 [Elysia marginata]